MILEFVTFKTPDSWGRGHVLDDAKHTIGKWVSNHDLLRKHFVLGIGEDAGTSGGIYLWSSAEAAKKAHDHAWREDVKNRFGSYPTIRYFDLFLLIDNEQRRVTEWTAEGEAHEISREIAKEV